MGSRSSGVEAVEGPLRRKADHDPTKADAVETAVALAEIKKDVTAGNVARKALANTVNAGFTEMRRSIKGVKDDIATHSRDAANTAGIAKEAAIAASAAAETARLAAIAADNKATELRNAVEPLLAAATPFITVAHFVKKWRWALLVGIPVVAVIGGPAAVVLALKIIAKMLNVDLP